MSGVHIPKLNKIPSSKQVSRHSVGESIPLGRGYVVGEDPYHPNENRVKKKYRDRKVSLHFSFVSVSPYPPNTTLSRTFKLLGVILPGEHPVSRGHRSVVLPRRASPHTLGTRQRSSTGYSG